MALLYDFYLDEEEYFKNPERFPNGLEDKRLYYVEKDNGRDIQLGMFIDKRASDVSAVLINPLATFAKAQSMRTDKVGLFVHMWVTNDNQQIMTNDMQELIEDGLLVLHNPYAKNPLDRKIFKKERINQVFMEKGTLKIEKDFGEKHLFSRITADIIVNKSEKKKNSI